MGGGGSESGSGGKAEGVGGEGGKGEQASDDGEARVTLMPMTAAACKRAAVCGSAQVDAHAWVCPRGAARSRWIVSERAPRLRGVTYVLTRRVRYS